MEEPTADGRRASGSSPLADITLFYMYMEALDGVVAEPEIRSSLQELGYSLHVLRNHMIADARRILETAPREFAAYESARADISMTRITDAESPRDFFAQRRSAGYGWISRGGRALSLGLGMAAAGLLLTLAGVGSILFWSWAGWLLGVGALLFAVSLIPLALSFPAAREVIGRLSGEAALDTPRVTEAREDLMAAITHRELLAQVRAWINDRRQGQFHPWYSVSNISGLSESYDSTYQVPTRTAADLEGLLARLDGASIGVAGPRGSGKSTLIRGYCDSTAGGLDLRCMVNAPVDYDARDFVLHLFSVFCRAVMDRYGQASGTTFWERAAKVLSATRYAVGRLLGYCSIYAVPAAALMHWDLPIARFLSISAYWPFGGGICLAILGLLILTTESSRNDQRSRTVVAVDDHTLNAAARRHLARVRYLQTYTSGWSGTLVLPHGSGQYSKGSSRAERQRSLPEIVGEFQEFVRTVADYLHRNKGSVFIGIDELDRISTPEQAEQFLNQIKGIFGIPHVYFMVSVSDDALTSFERRGLPLRDTFDSSFDEIVHVGPLSYAESRRLLSRRVIGLSEPYVALCHCLAGGLARDVVRAARQIVQVGDVLAADAESGGISLSNVCAALLRDELRRQHRAVIRAASNSADDTHALLERLGDVARRHLDFPGPGHLLKMAGDIARSAPGEPASVVTLRTDFAAYAYYCATLQDVFTDDLDPVEMMRAAESADDPGSFDSLAAARRAFALNTHVAWRAVTECRKARGLETRELTETGRLKDAIASDDSSDDPFVMRWF